MSIRTLVKSIQDIMRIDLTKFTETGLINYGVRANGIGKRNKRRIGNRPIAKLLNEVMILKNKDW